MHDSSKIATKSRSARFDRLADSQWSKIDGEIITTCEKKFSRIDELNYFDNNNNGAAGLPV